MNTVIVFTAFQRPDYLEESLASWKNVKGIERVKKHMFLEPSPFKDVMLEVIKDSGLNIEVHENENLNGVLHNPWVALDYSFSTLKADFTILAEDDLIVSRDVLKYFKTASTCYSPEQALGVCSFNIGSESTEESMYLDNAFDVWIWGTWKESWNDHLRNTWDHDYSTNNGNPGVQAGWDWNISRLTQTGKPFVRSGVSRSQHIGRDRGTHMVPWMFDQFHASSFDLNRETKYFYKTNKRK